MLIEHNNLELAGVKVWEAVFISFLGLCELIRKQIVSIQRYLLFCPFWLHQIVSYDYEVLLLLLFVAEETNDSLVVVGDKDAKRFELCSDKVPLGQIQKVTPVVVEPVSSRLLQRLLVIEVDVTGNRRSSVLFEAILTNSCLSFEFIEFKILSLVLSYFFYVFYNLSVKVFFTHGCKSLFLVKNLVHFIEPICS